MTKQNEAATTEAPALKLLGRADIDLIEELKRELVPVPEWGGAVMVWEMTGTERDSYENDCLVLKGKERVFSMENVRAKLCARSIKNEKGVRLYEDDEVPILGKKSAAALNRVFEVASRLSGLNKKDIDELAAGLKNAPSAAA